MSIEQISKKNIYELTHIELQYLTKGLNIKRIHIKNLYTSVLRKLNKEFENVKNTIAIFLDKDGLKLSPRQITLRHQATYQD